MSKQLIRPTLIEQINKSHLQARFDIHTGADTASLAKVLIDQIEQAEADLMQAVFRLAAKYEHAHELAITAQPNVQLSSLLMAAGIQTQPHDHDHEQGNLY